MLWAWNIPYGGQVPKKLLLGLTLFLIRRNRPLFQEAVNFLVLPKHVFYYSAPWQFHQHVCPLPFPTGREGGLQLQQVYAVHPCVSYQE